ncbi:MAG: hypothetical protein KKB38_21045 [Gammaproteobacteria bacterium]|nr:hypothetical protein [Gammaproteobacteria bacterium]
MIKIKELAPSATKWDDNAARAADTFATEAEAAADVWARNAAGAEDNYKLGITAPNISVRFRRGVQKAGAAKFARKIRDVARDRFGPGIHAAVEDWRSGFEPFHTTIGALVLPARKPRGDPANYGRVEAVGKALNTKRLALLAAAS